MLSFELIKNINQYIKDRYTGEEDLTKASEPQMLGGKASMPAKAFGVALKNACRVFSDVEESIENEAFECASVFAPIDGHFEEISKILQENTDESFAQTLTRLIDAKGMTDSECYNKAGLNRAHFNKIKNNPDYNVQKETVFALALALELSKEETEALLGKVGFAFSTLLKTDLIVEYCIENKIYNLGEVNEILYAFDQKILGSGVRA